MFEQKFRKMAIFQRKSKNPRKFFQNLNMFSFKGSKRSAQVSKFNPDHCNKQSNIALIESL